MVCAVCCGFVHALPLFGRAVAPRIVSGIRPDQPYRRQYEIKHRGNSAIACPYQVLMGIFDNFCAAMDLMVMLDYLLLPERAFRFAFSSGMSYSGSCGL